MKKNALIFMTLVFALCAVIGCGKNNGKIAEKVIHSGRYTYVKINENGDIYWIAGPQTQVKKGEKLIFTKSMFMKKFHSKKLKRDFEPIYFVNKIIRDSGQLVSGMKKVKKDVSQKKVKPGSIDKVAGGYSVSEIYQKKDQLRGKEVKVKGRVVKFNANIMNRNWIHVQDGTGEKGSHDLAVTSSEKVKKGQLVVVTGKVSYNKDFGSGYVYDAIIQKAKIKIIK